MLYMVLERYRDGNGRAVYERFRENGRMLPEGLQYIDSWVEPSMDRCFQLMKTEDPALFDRWIANWSDLVEFEIREVLSSVEAAELNQ